MSTRGSGFSLPAFTLDAEGLLINPRLQKYECLNCPHIHMLQFDTQLPPAPDIATIRWAIMLKKNVGVDPLFSFHQNVMASKNISHVALYVSGGNMSVRRAQSVRMMREVHSHLSLSWGRKRDMGVSPSICRTELQGTHEK